MKINKRKGPNGTKLICFFFKIIKDIGKANKLAKKITNKHKNGCKTSPATNINFISPPPRLSFLNKKLPNNIIKYITLNIIKPDKILNKAYKIPLFKQLIIIKQPEKNINT